jgi:hypothetical protein
MLLQGSRCKDEEVNLHDLEPSPALSGKSVPSFATIKNPKNI